MTARALIAEDEPLLAQALVSELRRQWPELQLLPVAEDGPGVIADALREQPDLLFLDIRMPGCSGLDAAAAIVDDWPAARALPLIVFVTAYDQHALEAFERHAVDYLLKPLEPERLARCCARLKDLLRPRGAVAAGPEASGADALASPERLLATLQQLMAPGAPAAAPTPPLSAITAAVGASVYRVPLTEVLCFEAADKYVRVLTAAREYLIRTPLRELLPQLPPGDFEQVHRSVVVRADAIEAVTRDEAGRLMVQLRGLAQAQPVSRLYAHRFRAM